MPFGKMLYRASETDFGVWCNGNTADSGPAFPGSSPGTPTNMKTSRLISIDWFFLFFFLLYMKKNAISFGIWEKIPNFATNSQNN